MSKFGSLIAVGVMALSVTACGTMSGAVKTSASNPAPVSFKGGQVDPALASKVAARPSLKPYISADSMDYVAPVQPRNVTMPQQTARLNTTTPTPSPKVMPERFDQSGVDTDLYMHQRVGRPYTIKGKRYTPEHNPSYDETGIASWYGPNFHGKLTANGETYDKNGLTAAHKTLPLNSTVFVTNLENGKTIMLRVNDRGPFVDGRIIDLSEGAAKALGVTGLADVRVQYAGPADPNAGKKQSSQAEVTPTPKAPVIIAPEPEMPTQTLPPVAQAPTYKPLSVVPYDLKEQVSLPGPETVSPIAPQFSLPQTNLPVIPGVPDIAPESTRVAPLVPQIQTPSRGRQDFVPPQDGGVMTLTIKGPIHMASMTDDVKAEFIPAVYEGKTPEMSASNGVHYVQAATFSSMSRVQSVRSTLEAAGNVTVHDIKRGETVLHRVMVGPFTDESTAANALSLVATLGYTDARIVEMH